MMHLNHLGANLKLPSQYKSGYYIREQPLPLPRYCWIGDLPQYRLPAPRGVIFPEGKCNPTQHTSHKTVGHPPYWLGRWSNACQAKDSTIMRKWKLFFVKDWIWKCWFLPWRKFLNSSDMQQYHRCVRGLYRVSHSLPKPAVI